MQKNTHGIISIQHYFQIVVPSIWGKVSSCKNALIASGVANRFGDVSTTSIMLQQQRGSNINWIESTSFRFVSLKLEMKSYPRLLITPARPTMTVVLAWKAFLWLLVKVTAEKKPLALQTSTQLDSKSKHYLLFIVAQKKYDVHNHIFSNVSKINPFSHHSFSHHLNTCSINQFWACWKCRYFPLSE